MTIGDAILDVLDRVGGWVGSAEVSRQLLRRHGISMEPDEVLDQALELEHPGLVRSVLYLQVTPAGAEKAHARQDGATGPTGQTTTDVPGENGTARQEAASE